MMSGFKMPKRTARICLHGDYEGAELVCNLDVGINVAFGFFTIDMAKPAEALDQIREFCSQVLVEWNLVEDDETPIPATPEEFVKRPVSFMQAVLMGWKEAAMEPAAPLDAPSLNGATLPEGFALTDLS